jgi:hypothetical protein
MSGFQLWTAFSLVLSLGVLVLGIVPLWLTIRRRGRPGPAPVAFSVTISGGPGGSLVYEEGAQRQRFDWELAARGSVVAYVYVPTYAQWPERVPWAAERREEILDRVAAEVHRQKCPGCRWEVGEDMIYLYER